MTSILSGAQARLMGTITGFKVLAGKSNTGALVQEYPACNLVQVTYILLY